MLCLYLYKDKINSLNFYLRFLIFLPDQHQSMPHRQQQIFYPGIGLHQLIKFQYPACLRIAGIFFRDLTGYAAISMAMGMGEKGVLHTIDINDEIEDFTRNYIERSGLAGQIVFHIGDACEIIPGLDECFDLVFIDADKRQYAAYYRLVFDKVRPGGIIVADDVLHNR